MFSHTLRHCERRVTAVAIRFSFRGITDSFALTTLAVPKSCYSLGARTTFDCGARRCSLLPAPQALATSLRMTLRGFPLFEESVFLVCAVFVLACDF